MKYLIIINAAFKMGKFHAALAEELKSKGDSVIYVLPDKLPLYTESLDLKNDIVYFFSDYFKDNYNKAQLNSKYKDLNINKMFFSDYDRNIVYSKMKFFGNDYYQKLMISLVNFFDMICNENKIDLCIYESISNSFAYAAYEVLKINNISYCGYAGCRLKGRFELYTEEFGSVDKFKNEFENLNLLGISKDRLSLINKYLKQYDTEDMPSYHPKNTSLDWNFSLFKRYFNMDKIQLIKGSFLFLFREKRSIKFSYQIGNPVKELLSHFYLQLKKQYRIRFMNKYFDSIDNSEKYYLYPQHFKPESSTSVLARHYCDDLSVIRNIAFNLPFGTMLYVKEHFVNFGRLSVDYYKELKKIPNVRLISFKENTKSLIFKSEGVITLTSTVGFEALMMNKLVYVFGNVFYQCHPNCHKITSYDNLFKQFQSKQLNIETDVNQRFILAYENISYIGNIYYTISEGYKENDFTDPLIKAINESFEK